LHCNLQSSAALGRHREEEHGVVAPIFHDGLERTFDAGLNLESRCIEKAR